MPFLRINTPNEFDAPTFLPTLTYRHFIFRSFLLSKLITHVHFHGRTLLLFSTDKYCSCRSSSSMSLYFPFAFTDQYNYSDVFSLMNISLILTSTKGHFHFCTLSLLNISTSDNFYWWTALYRLTLAKLNISTWFEN